MFKLINDGMVRYLNSIKLLKLSGMRVNFKFETQGF